MNADELKELERKVKQSNHDLRLAEIENDLAYEKYEKAHVIYFYIMEKNTDLKIEFKNNGGVC